MAAVKTFSLQRCSISFGGIPISGFGPDDAITIEASNEAWVAEIGSDGDLSRYQKPVYYKVKITLAQTSKTNDAFEAIHIADKISGGGVLPFGFKDENGTSLTALTGAFFLGEPSAAYGTSAKTREWNLAGVGENFIGGN